MTRERIEAVTCDRCGESVQFSANDGDREQWAILHACQRNDVPIVGDHEAPADLCPPCTAELVDWLKGRPLAALT